MTALLRMEGITKQFGAVAALRGASLQVAAGEAHALLGANGAGKSTLMNVLGGFVPRDGGHIAIGGQDVEIGSPAEAGALGIRFVQQELNMLPSMTVAENVLIDDLPTRYGRIDRRAARARAAALLDRLQCSFGPDDPVEALGMGDRQMVEIARALARDPHIMIFDEPTSSLSDREKRRLFEVIARMKAGGAAVIYITHFIEEIFQVCDRVTVMRGGATWLERGRRDRRGRDRAPDARRHPRARPPARGRAPRRAGAERAWAEHQPALGGRAHPARRRDLGLWGLLGSGRTEIMRALVGLDPISAGEIRLRGRGGLAPVMPAALHEAVGFVTEDRRGEGLLLPLSVAANIAYANLDKVTDRLGLIAPRRQRRFAEELVRRVGIVLANVAQPVSTLSGGNQQKVVLARWLGTAPRIFFLDEPTRGLDAAPRRKSCAKPSSWPRVVRRC